MTVSPYKLTVQSRGQTLGRVATIDLEAKSWGGHHHERRPIMGAFSWEGMT